ncbi:MAG TPA: chemotaxis protein CheW [Terriglobales bacterium]|nr:chemotaxis protein CheW [Terriglobales bacterium]
MKISSTRRRRVNLQKSETAILFSLSGYRFAIAAGAVDEIRPLAGLKEFQPTVADPRFAKVKHILERQGRRYFVIDTCALFHVPPSDSSRLLLLRNVPAAVMVDGIEQMHEIETIHALPLAFAGEERRWYRGIALIRGRVVPVVSVEAFLTRAEAALLSAMTPASGKEAFAEVTA